MTVIKSLNTWCKLLPSIAETQKDEIYLALCNGPSRPIVTLGNMNDIDLNYCKKAGLIVVDQKREGGSIIFFEDNIGLGLIYNKNLYPSYVLYTFYQDFVQFLQNKNINAAIIDNDIMIDGKYKIAGYMKTSLPPNFIHKYEGLQISINVDNELINNICTKEMIKIPKGLSDYGITAAEVNEWVNQWLIDNFHEEFLNATYIED